MQFLVFTEAETDVIETPDPALPTGIRKLPGAVTMRFDRIDAERVPDGYEFDEIRFLRRKPGG